MNVHVLTYIGNISKNIYISQILLNYIFFNAFICWLVVLPAVLHKYTWADFHFEHLDGGSVSAQNRPHKLLVQLDN